MTAAYLLDDAAGVRLQAEAEDVAAESVDELTLLLGGGDLEELLADVVAKGVGRELKDDGKDLGEDGGALDLRGGVELGLYVARAELIVGELDNVTDEVVDLPAPMTVGAEVLEEGRTRDADRSGRDEGGAEGAGEDGRTKSIGADEAAGDEAVA
jgi:hypothetical protein